MSRRVAFIINSDSGAGRGQVRWFRLRDRFPVDGTESRVLFTSEPGAAVQLARDAAREYDAVVAVGGDGTVFEVASGLLLSGVAHPVLGIVPVGTGNDTARLCGIDSPVQGMEALHGTRSRRLDVVRIECQAPGAPVVRYSLLYGAVGLIGAVVKQTTPLVKKIFGQRLAYPVGAARAILSYRAPPMRVTCDGQTWEKRFLLVCASNAELSGGGMRLAPGARMDDGLLNLNVCEEVGRAAAIGLLWRISRGRQFSHPKLRYFTARKMTVESESPLEVQADGETIGHTPARIEVLPQGLEVLVP